MYPAKKVHLSEAVTLAAEMSGRSIEAVKVELLAALRDGAIRGMGNYQTGERLKMLAELGRVLEAEDVDQKTYNGIYFVGGALPLCPSDFPFPCVLPRQIFHHPPNWERNQIIDGSLCSAFCINLFLEDLRRVFDPRGFFNDANQTPESRIFLGKIKGIPEGDWCNLTTEKISELPDGDLWSSPTVDALFETIPVYCDSAGPSPEGSASPGTAEAVPLSSGAPGRPSSMHLIEGEFQRRVNAREANPVLADEARSLRSWLVSAYPSAAPPSEKTIKNRLRAAHKGFMKARNSTAGA